MSRAFATEVRVSAGGVCVVGTRAPRTRVWFRSANRASARMHEFTMPFVPPAGAPATVLPDGRMLLVGQRCETMLVEVGRSPQPVAPVGTLTLLGVSREGVAYAQGPQFLTCEHGVWQAQPSALDPQLAPTAVGEGFAVGEHGACWVLGAKGWARKPLDTDASFRCAEGNWAGGDGVVLQRTGRRFVLHEVDGVVTSICAWQKAALLVIDGTLRTLSGAPLPRAPSQVTSVSAHGERLACISNGQLLESSNARVFSRLALPK